MEPVATYRPLESEMHRVSPSHDLKALASPSLKRTNIEVTETCRRVEEAAKKRMATEKFVTYKGGQ